MKTIDEVIDGLRDRIGLGDPVLVDAIHYLKEYATSLHNEPLTWSELEMMGGKPVWIESSNGKGWGIACEFYRDMFGKGKVTFRTLLIHRLHLNEINLGKTWQAYKKERE